MGQDRTERDRNGQVTGMDRRNKRRSGTGRDVSGDRTRQSAADRVEHRTGWGRVRAGRVRTSDVRGMTGQSADKEGRATRRTG